MLASQVDEAAGRKSKTPDSFPREMITETAAENTQPFDPRLLGLNGLTGQMSVLARSVYAIREEAQD